MRVFLLASTDCAIFLFQQAREILLDDFKLDVFWQGQSAKRRCRYRGSSTLDWKYDLRQTDIWDGGDKGVAGAKPPVPEGKPLYSSSPVNRKIEFDRLTHRYVRAPQKWGVRELLQRGA